MAQESFLSVPQRENPPCAADGGQCIYEIREKVAINGAVHHHPTCTKCGRQLTAVPKPGNEGKRREGTKNAKWYPYLRSLHADGHLHCVLCDWKQTEPEGHGEVHHLVPLGKGGKDEERNVVWLCMACHLYVTGMRKRTDGLREAYRKIVRG